MHEITVTDVRVQPGDSGFLLDDSQTAILCDSGFGFTGFAMAEKIKACLGDRPLDYIFLTHSHYDHALGSAYILRHFPEAKVVAGTYAAAVFQRPGAKRVMRELDRSFADHCAVGDYPFLGDELRVDIPVAEGDTVKAGTMEFEVLELPGHTRCSVGYFCRERGLLVATETLGVYDGGVRIVPSYLVSYRAALESMRKVNQLPIANILAPHLGLLNREQTAWFLENMESRSVEGAEYVKDLLDRGTDKETIIRAFQEKYCRGYIDTIYPEAAARLNTSIMVDLLEKEL